MLPCLPIAMTVTSVGRECAAEPNCGCIDGFDVPGRTGALIQGTKEAVEKKFTVANGYPANAAVIYG